MLRIALTGGQARQNIAWAACPHVPASLKAQQPVLGRRACGAAEAGGILVACGNEAIASYPQPRTVLTPGLAEFLR